MKIQCRQKNDDIKYSTSQVIELDVMMDEFRDEVIEDMAHKDKQLKEKKGNYDILLKELRDIEDAMEYLVESKQKFSEKDKQINNMSTEITELETKLEVLGSNTKEYQDQVDYDIATIKKQHDTLQNINRKLNIRLSTM